jgi:CBS domain-containing protein
MNAHDLMSTDVVTVAPETPLRDVAKILLRHRISAVPVVDDGGALVGIVSEGDLVGRKKTERETRSEWWLMHLAEGEPLNNEYLAHLQSPLAVAREIMSSPVIAVSEDTPMDDIATLMGAHRVKRLPVLRDGHLVGVVRRADLLRTIGGGIFAPVPRPLEPRPDQIASIHHQFGGAKPNGAKPFQAGSAISFQDEDLTADDLRHLVAHHRQELDAERARRRAEAAEQSRRDLHRLIETHVTDKLWDAMIHSAREAAERGETEFLMLRFPSQLCSDGGRAINAPDPDWPKTLRGEAAELYLRWERELRPRHLHIAARVLEFPGGVPGDIGLFLCWGV